MKLNMMKIGVLVAAGVIPLTQNAVADTTSKHDVQAYIGANYGGYKSRGDEFEDENDLIEGVLGVRLTEYFSIEGGYTYFGEFGGDFTEVTLDGYSVAGIFRWPATEHFGVYIKGGYMWWNGDVEVLGEDFGGDEDLEGEEPFYGVGVDFDINDHFNVALEYSRIEVDLSDSNLPDAIDDYETELDTVKVGAKFLF